MNNDNKTNQGQNDLNKTQKPVSNAGVGTQDQGKNVKTPGQGQQGQKIGQDADVGSRQVSNKPGQQPGQGNIQNDMDDDKATQRQPRPNLDRDPK